MLYYAHRLRHLGSDNILWEQNNILREQDNVLWEQNNILRKQDNMLLEQNIFLVRTK